MQPVRVLFMDHVPRMSGAEQSLAELVVGLKSGPVEPVVAVPADGPLAAELRAHGVLVRQVPMSRALLETSRATLARKPLIALARLAAFLAAGWRTWRLICEIRPHVVHTNTLKTHLIAVLPCKLARVPLVWHLRDILPPGWLRRAIVAIGRAASVIIVPSRAVAEPFRGTAVYRRLRLIPNGVHVEEFAEATADRSLREMLGVTKSDPVIGIVGRIAPWKGQDVFLRAAAMLAARHPRAHFAVVGAVLFPENDIPFERALHQMTLQLGISDRVSFLGWQPAPEAMAAIDVFVHASQEPEPFGRAIVEAMAAGKPVVAAAGGAVEEILPPAAGFIVPPARPELLADALDRLLTDRKLRTRMGKAGTSIAASFFPVERTVSSVGQLYRGLAVGAARRKARGPISTMRRKLHRRRRPARTRPQQAPAERAIVWPAPNRAAGRDPREERRPVNGNGNGNGNGTEQPAPPPSFDGVEMPAGFDEGPDRPRRVRIEREIEPRAPRPVAPDAGRGTAVVERTSKRTVAMRAPTIAPRRVSVSTGGAVAIEAPVAMPVPVVVPAPARVPAAAPDEVFRPKPVYEAVKRVLDLAISLGVLVLGLPLWVLIAIAIKLESPGPVMFRGTVVGRGCTPFTYFKFRSMRIDGDDSAHRRFIERYVRENGGHEHDGEIVYKLMADDRVTAVGRWIRRFSLDEVPQLLNVLRGEMSVVGPRPPLDYEFEHYDERSRRRLRVKPGITGMQQVWHRHSASFDDKLKLDEKYIRLRSVWLDVKLIVHTFRAAINGH
jgi:lipopolysaccharide/colanic/teichoic acid biosynthesis glycosyltransferase/glycosyltransferase involved in cell wall biosynthesis